MAKLARKRGIYGRIIRGYKPDMNEATILRKIMADLRDEIGRERMEIARLHKDGGKIARNEIFKDKQSGHLVMADPDDPKQEPRRHFRLFRC